MRVAVTGANGFLGSNLCKTLSAKSIEVKKITRKEWDLGKAGDPGVFKDCDFLVHAAYDFAPTEQKTIFATNVEAAKRMLSAALGVGVKKIVFVSSLSAFDGCESNYGLAKLALEKWVLENKGVVLRPGLIISDEPKGIVGKITSIATKLPILPLVGAQQKLYVSQIDQLCDFIMRVIESDSNEALPIACAYPNPYTFAEIVSKLAAAKGKTPFLVPVPWQILWLLLRFLEALGIRIGLRSDSLIGLMKSNPNVSFERAKQLGANFQGLT